MPESSVQSVGVLSIFLEMLAYAKSAGCPSGGQRRWGFQSTVHRLLGCPAELGYAEHFCQAGVTARAEAGRIGANPHPPRTTICVSCTAQHSPEGKRLSCTGPSASAKRL